MPDGKFQVYRDKNGRFRFILRDPNNKIIATSEAYRTKHECMTTVNAVKECYRADIEDYTTDRQPQRRVLSDTTLILHDPIRHRRQKLLDKGSTLTFTGQLLSKNRGLGGARISIYDSDRSFLRDDLMAWGMTKDDGTFKISWEVKDMDSILDTIPNIFDTVEVYAKFEETTQHRSSISKQYTLFISKSNK